VGQLQASGGNRAAGGQLRSHDSACSRLYELSVERLTSGWDRPSSEES
jgi:hypothetical protein